MNKGTKHLFLLLRAGLLTVFMLIAIGCQRSGDSDLITLNVYSQLANYSGIQTGWYAALLEDKFGVRLNIIPDTAGTYQTRVESGNLGDIVVWGNNGADYQNAVRLGLLFDWEEDDIAKTYAPNIWNNAQTALEANREISGTGKIYGLGHRLARSMQNHESFFYTWDIRWDLYDQLGRPEVTDLDSYVELMKKMKEINPVDFRGNPTYAVSLWPDWDGTMVMYPKSLATAYYGYDEMAIGLYDPEDGTLYDALDIDGPYIEALRFFNKLFQNDLLDPDSASQTFQQMSEKLRNGGTFFSIFDFSGSLGFNTQDNMNNGMMMLSLVPSEASPAVYGMSTLGGNRVWSIGAESRYPELSMEILNWLYSPDGAMSIWYGLRDLHWYYDEDGYTHLTELGQTVRDNPNHDQAGVEWTSPYSGETYMLGASFNDGMLQVNNTTWVLDSVNPDSNGETFNVESWKSQQNPPRNDMEASWREFTGANNTQEYMSSGNYTVIPATNYAESVRSDELEVTWNQVTTTINNFSWRAMFARSDAEFDRIIQTMIRQCNAYGYDKVLEWSLNEAAIRFQLQQDLKALEAGN
ncbi:type 2 periplasmic-binding domain-containing protein [Spirochaeta dissipatitropha]